jgi:alpha-ketoglutarate-dependent taurine dioxygenase
MKVTKIPTLGNKGIFIDDVNLETISDEEWMEIGRLHLENLVTIVRDPNCSKERYGELINKFGTSRPAGTLSKKYREQFNKGWDWVMQQVRADSSLIDPDDKYIINVGEHVTVRTDNGYAMAKIAGGYSPNGLPNGFFADGELLWHSNQSGTLTWVPGVALMGVENMIGSSTGFIATNDYYENVSESFRSELDEMIVVHKFTSGKINPGLNPDHDKLMNFNMCPVDNTEVPMVVTSPGGVKGLHYAINTVDRIKGMSSADSQRVFDEINKNLFVEKYIYDHWYQNNNDLLLFDNSITLHRRQGNTDGRLALRIPFDYTHLQDGPYEPYQNHPEFQREYNRQIREIVKMLGIKDFKLPKRTFKELLGF